MSTTNSESCKQSPFVQLFSITPKIMAAVQRNEVVFPKDEIINISFPKYQNPTLVVIPEALTKSREKPEQFAVKRLHSKGQTPHSQPCAPFTSLHLLPI